MCCTARTKAPSDSPDQSSNAPLITQEVRRRHSYFITLINSLSDTAAINPPFFPAAELQGGGWLMRMRSPLYMCGEIPRKWAPLTAGDWLHRAVGVWLSVCAGWRAGIWGKPYFLFGVKGQFERMRRGHGQMVQEGHMWCDTHTTRTHSHQIFICVELMGRGDVFLIQEFKRKQ